MFLNLLTSRSPKTDDDPAEFQIDDTYSVPGVGTVVSGTNLKGTIRLNDTLLLGPDPLGHFQSIAVRSIHRKRFKYNFSGLALPLVPPFNYWRAACYFSQNLI